MKRKKRRRRNDDEFDPKRFTGKRNLGSYFGDLVYYFQLQLREIARAFGSVRRVAREQWQYLCSKFRK